ncbi:hypothetical protein HDU84_001806 [Entophlyctis sp. JEL0112]|nr:hypothetical protein HDU84_001806 [Entophlyctis sp. JEL0112]
MNLTCLTSKDSDAIPATEPPIFHGPVIPVESIAVIAEVATATSSDAPDATSTAPGAPDGQCVIKRARVGEACGDFVIPTVLCYQGLQCVFDLGYPPRNAAGVMYANVTWGGDNSGSVYAPGGGQQGACVQELPAMAPCVFGASVRYPPRCSVGMTCLGAVCAVAGGSQQQ